MYCCQAFENLISNAGESGLAVLVGQKDDKTFFALQMRSVSVSDMPEFVKEISADSSVHIALTQSIRICYCPSCGHLVADLAANNPEKFSQVSLTHEAFQDSWG